MMLIRLVARCIVLLQITSLNVQGTVVVTNSSDVLSVVLLSSVLLNYSTVSGYTGFRWYSTLGSTIIQVRLRR